MYLVSTKVYCRKNSKVPTTVPFLVRFDVIIDCISHAISSELQEICRFATMLSTGNYAGPKPDPKESFQLDLNEISRELTAAADFCAALQFNTLRILRTLEDFAR